MNEHAAIYTLKEMVAVRQALAKDGKRLVATNGCFDIIHPGHVASLEWARARGDALLVLINDDASVARLKGAERPIQTLSERMAVLCGLRSVSFVVPFSEDTPQAAYAALVPDVLVKGSEYAGRDIAGAREVEAAGGSVALCPILPGNATSTIIERIVRRYVKDPVQ